MYMANARILRLEPNATYIPLTRVGVLLGDAKKFASAYAKDTNMLVSFALGDAKVPNANGFVLQWNIGLRVRNIFSNVGGGSLSSDASLCEVGLSPTGGALMSRGAKCQNLGAFNSFESKNKRGGKFQTENLKRVVTCKMCCFYSIYKVHGFHHMESFVNNLDHICKNIN